MAETLTPTRLRRLTELAPVRGRVLSVYLNLDPSEFATPPARASAISSLMNDAQHKLEATDSDLPHDDRMALRADVGAEDSVNSQPRQGGWSQPRYERSVEEGVRDHDLTPHDGIAALLRY